MEGFITFIIIFAVSIWLIGKIFPLILKWYIKRKINKMGGNAAGYNNFNVDPEHARKREGEVTITGTQDKEKVIKKDVGEYIDFEENE